VLQFLLDAHLSPVIAQQISTRRPEITVISLRDWEDGAYLDAEDAVILARAHEQGLTLVTYDQRTIMPLVKEQGEQGLPHGGVIFVDQRTLAPNDFGGLVRALCQICREGRVEGRVTEAQEILLRQGTKRFGPPTEEARAALEGITAIERLELLTERLLDVESWDELLAS
jgi:hypothetical protein